MAELTNNDVKIWEPAETVSDLYLATRWESQRNVPLHALFTVFVSKHRELTYYTLMSDLTQPNAQTV